MKTKGPSAFTLIELLTVIAIIGILAAILIPVVGSVRESARSAQCISNLRQIHMGFMLYADANGELLPLNSNTNQSQYLDGVVRTRWKGAILPYMEEPMTREASSIFLYKFDPDVATVFTCPSRSEDHVFGPNHYGANVRVVAENEQQRLGHFESSVVLAADVYDWRLDPTNDGTLYPEGADGPGLQGRHKGADNVVFLDGSVRTIRRGELPSATSDPERELSLWGPRRAGNPYF